MSNFVREKLFFARFFCFWNFLSVRREGNFTSSGERKAWDSETERGEKKRKMLLNIIEKTCCINDFSSLLSIPLLFVVIYYYFRVQKESYSELCQTNSAEFMRKTTARISLKGFLWTFYSRSVPIRVDTQKSCWKFPHFSCSALLAWMYVHGLCRFNHGNLLFLMDF